jgi:glycyl-tRNA synthetase beta chain
MSRLLLEVGTEELPPSELPGVLEGMGPAARALFAELRLPCGDVTVFSSPRRLALAVADLADVQEARSTVVTGPPVKAAFDPSGAPTKAAVGFARTQGVAVEALTTVKTERGDYVAVHREEPRGRAADVLPDALTRFVLALPFAKQMRWGDGEHRFVRPVRWVVALLDGQVLPMTLGGLTAGRVTHGHRFLGPAAGVTLANADAAAYVERLREAHVIVDIESRRKAVWAQCMSVLPPGHRAVEDEETLVTVVHLIEEPYAVLGSFPAEFLALPPEVVETPIRHHQKCLTVETESGRLAPMFVGIANMPDVDGAIRRGYERVIRARLADADFYYRLDLQRPLADLVPQLGGIVFQDRLGTLLEKTERLVALTGLLAGDCGVPREPVQRAALLAKADLASGMVREFPELQGVMGARYAEAGGEPAAVARAIREHYLPRSADDGVPGGLEGALLGIADRIDTIAGCIGIGLVPRGSEDPYALRRHAQGIVQIAIALRIRMSLGTLVDRAIAQLSAKLTEPAEATRTAVLEFLRGRLATVLAARGHRRDAIEAVLASGADDPADAARRADAVTSWTNRPDWDALAMTFRRVLNILPEQAPGAADPARFVDDAERRLHREVAARREAIEAATRRGDYEQALEAIAALRPAVDEFFTAVLVMDKDAAIRDNRLALLASLGGLMLAIADLRTIQTAG